VSRCDDLICQCPSYVPVFLLLRDYAEAIASEKPPTLAELATAQEANEKLDPPQGWFEQELSRGKCIVFLDGLDEVGDLETRGRVGRWVDKQMGHYGSNRFLITSRPYGYKASLLSQTTVLEVQPFGIEQIAHFVNSWYLATELHSSSKDDPGVLDSALRLGLRGLPGESSLARLLLEEYGVLYQKSRANLTVAKILTWADAFHEQHGRWPTTDSGVLGDAPEQNWRGIDNALRYGYRGLPGGSSLAQILAQRRGVRNLKARPRLTYRQILIWADLQRRSTGQWPTAASGALPFAPRETWSGINASLKLGRRGLPGGDTLAQLLARERGVRHPNSPPRLSVEQILRWADAYQQRTGQWPRATSAAIPEAEGETWLMINRALQEGKRGLRGGSSLFGLLREKRGVTRR
jgi:hypothetical protein